ncbi:MAG: hypothetical protein ACYCSO_10470 [Cuniculiplasma sp.]
MRIEIGECFTVEFEMSLFQEESNLLPVHIFERSMERFEMLEINRSMIKSINYFLNGRKVKTAFLTIRRESRLKYDITPGTFIITKEKGKFPIQ